MVDPTAFLMMSRKSPTQAIRDAAKKQWSEDLAGILAHSASLRDGQKNLNSPSMLEQNASLLHLSTRQQRKAWENLGRTIPRKDLEKIVDSYVAMTEAVDAFSTTAPSLLSAKIDERDQLIRDIGSLDAVMADQVATEAQLDLALTEIRLKNFDSAIQLRKLQSTKHHVAPWSASAVLARFLDATKARVRARILRKRHAAILIQCLYRCSAARSATREARRQRNVRIAAEFAAASTVNSRVRGFVERRRFAKKIAHLAKLRRASLRIQSAWRAKPCRDFFKQIRITSSNTETTLAHKAAAVTAKIIEAARTLKRALSHLPPNPRNATILLELSDLIVDVDNRDDDPFLPRSNTATIGMLRADANVRRLLLARTVELELEATSALAAHPYRSFILVDPPLPS